MALNKNCLPVIDFRPTPRLVKPVVPTAHLPELQLKWTLPTDMAGRRQLCARWQKQQEVLSPAEWTQLRLSNLNESSVIIEGSGETLVTRMMMTVNKIQCWALVLMCLLATVKAQELTTPAQQSTSEPQAHTDQFAVSDPLSMFPHHPENSWWWVSGQVNYIYQTNPPFPALYSGKNSFRNNYQKAISGVLTLYTGARLNNSTEILFDVEETNGGGLSDALGIAGFTNLDVVRNPTLGKTPYIARAIFHKVIALSTDKVEAVRTPFSLFTELPRRRLEFRIGKFSAADYFDVNTVGSDSHSQFMNWTVDNSGAYDYPADTRGYTYGAVVEFQNRSWGIRAAELLMPTVANGIDVQWNLRLAHAESVEFELRKNFLRGRPGIIRLLGYSNVANMGIYRVQNEQFLAGIDPTPDITAHPVQQTRKYGFGFNFEQFLAQNVKAFGRFGWNNGKTESYAYTEVDQSVEAGIGLYGPLWKRKYDKAGFVFVSNGIAADHQFYLQHGGLGFLLGDGNLNYGRETIFETYYNAHIWRGLYGGIDFQHITNPGYNRDRGPVFVPGLRLHVEF
jgi:high affinity Mn2+ porin